MPAPIRDYNIAYTAERVVYQLNKTTGAWMVVNRHQAQSDSAYLDVNNGWRAIKPDPLGFTSRSLYANRYSHMRGKREFVQGTDTYREVGMIQGTVDNNFPVTLVKATLINEALIDALQKLKDQKWNAGVALAESAGIARMLNGAGELVQRVRKNLRKGDFGAAYQAFRKESSYMGYPTWRQKYWDEVKHIKSVRRARTIPEGWTYYHFGLKPTIDDIDNATQELIQGEQRNPNIWNGFVEGYARSKYAAVVPKNSGSVWRDCHRTSMESVRVVVPVLRKNPLGARLSQLGVTNPPEAVYNGIPFSWVLDYFTSVGDWLSVMDSNLFWEFGDWAECYRLSQQSVSHPTDRNPQTIAGSQRMSKALWKNKVIERQVKAGVYGPLGQVLPMMKRRGPSTKQIANMLSVLATGFGMPVRP